MRHSLFPLLALLSSTLFGQQGSTAGIYGTVYDPQQSPVPQAIVSAVHVETGRTRTTKTNAAGQYVLHLLPVGPSRLEVAQPGFARYERSGLHLQINDSVKADVTLRGCESVCLTVDRRLPASDCWLITGVRRAPGGR